MTDQPSDDGLGAIKSELASLEKTLLQTSKDQVGKFTKDLIIVQNRLYAQVEALTWLSRAVNLSGSLPPLRGWAASPDVLLRLHEHIRFQKPKVVVECGSGSSTLVIADALRQNGEGLLISLEHSAEFGAKTRALVEREGLTHWVDLRIAELEPWMGPHLNRGDEETVKWYSSASLNGIKNIDLLFVDGPPGATCKYARYPALPALEDRLAPGAEIWMDDTVRQEETDISKDWAERYGYHVEFSSLEKGLGRLTPRGASVHNSSAAERKTLADPEAAVKSRLERYIAEASPTNVLQFGISAYTVDLARALKRHGGGCLVCVSEPGEALDTLRSLVSAEQLEAFLKILPAPLEDWPYRHLQHCDAALKQWFSESALEGVSDIDWVVVDGPDWSGEPCCRYPAFPSIMEQLAPQAELWMLGAQDSRVEQVVDAWREHSVVVSEPSEEGIVFVKMC